MSGHSWSANEPGRDISGGDYPPDAADEEARNRWDLALLVTAGEMFPYISDFPPSLLWPKALTVYRTNLETGPAEEVRRSLTAVRAAGGISEYLQRLAEEPGGA